MRLSAAAKAFDALESARHKVARVNSNVGALLAPAFYSTGLHKFITSPLEAEVVFSRVVTNLSEEKERSAFRHEVAKRAASEEGAAKHLKRKRGAPSVKANPAPVPVV